MSEWKSGDRVRFVSEDDGRLPYGLVGVVLHVYDTDIHFRADDGTTFVGCAHEFERERVDTSPAIGSKWWDRGIRDTFTVVGVQGDYISRMWGDGSGPTTTTRQEFERDAIETVDLEDLVDTDGVTLDPSDPFERVIGDIVATNRRKRADYALDGSPWSNFDDTANALGIEGFAPVDSANFNIERKSARLRSLRKNGRMDDPANESVADTYLDRAVYSVIALAMHKYPSGKVQ